MTEPASRRPRTFAPGDPGVVTPPSGTASSGGTPPEAETGPQPQYRAPTSADFQRGFRWGALFLSAIASLAVLAASLAFTNFVASALARHRADALP